jgi:hypothetical protein
LCQYWRNIGKGYTTHDFEDGLRSFHTVRKRLHLTTWKDHLKYDKNRYILQGTIAAYYTFDKGPVVRHGPNKLDFNTVTAMKGENHSTAVRKVLMSKDVYQNDRATKASILYLATQEAPGVFNIFHAVDGKMHRYKRKLVSPAVTERSIRTFEPIVIEQVDIFLKSLLSSTKPVNLKQRSQWPGYGVIGLLSFGYALDLQTSQTNRFLPRAIARYSRPHLQLIQFSPQVHSWSQVSQIPSIKSLRDMLSNIRSS